jgi:glycerol-3-phosphate acyltransferase PlsY
MPILVAIAIAGYLLGSIPFGYLLVRVFRGEDVRLSGSGNIGATNVARKSPVMGILTLLLDALKGAAAVLLATHFFPRPDTTRYVSMSLAALLAVLGHMFPLWLKFRGGKGVATGLGSFAMIAPKSVLIAAGLFVLIVLASRYVSLGSIVSVIAFPVLVWLFRQYGNSEMALALMACASALIIWKHRENIQRLLSGTENRFGAKRAV